MTVDVQINFTEPVVLQTFPIVDAQTRIGGLNRAYDVLTMQAGERHYAVVADQGSDAVHIVDISNPDLLNVVYSAENGTSFALDTPVAVDMARIGERQYVMVGTDGFTTIGLQLINVTDPQNPSPAGAVRGLQGDFALIDRVTDVSAAQIGGHHYALVVSSSVDGMNGAIVIVNVTDPDSPSYVWSERVGSGILAGYYYANNIHHAQIGGHHYAVTHVSGNVGSDIIILNITDPVSPTHVGDTFRGSAKMAVTEIDGSHYVLTSRYPEIGFTIVDITDPAAPYVVANVTEGSGNSVYNDLNSIIAVKTGETHYAVVATPNRIVVTNITDPANPSAVSVVSTKTGRDPLGSLYIRDGTVTISDRHYVPALSKNKDFFTMLDVTDPSQITEGRGDGSPKFDEILGAFGVATIKIDGVPYALVTASIDDGFQVIDMSDPSYPLPVASVTDGEDGFETLDSASFVAAVMIGDEYYAMVTAQRDKGIQIINITDPASPSPTASINSTTAGFGGMTFVNDIAVTEIGGHHYAMVEDRGQTVFVINVTNPASPQYVSNATNGQDGFVLDGTSGIAATEIGGRYYALVTSFNDNSLQVIDVTNPANPKAAGFARDGEDGFTELRHPLGITTAEIEGRHYALVTASDDDGLQIIDITNPYSLSAVSTFTAQVDYPTGVEVIQSGGHHYALVSNTIGRTNTSHLYVINVTDPSDPSLVTTVAGDGTDSFMYFGEPQSMPVVQVAGRQYVIVPGNLVKGLVVVDMTDPSNPSNPFLPHLRLDLGGDGDGYATYTGQGDDRRSMTFRYVTGPIDHTLDLSYDGVDALQMGRTVITDADGSSPIQVVLPEPGAPNSLSYSKQISVYGTDPREHFVTTWEVPSANNTITLPAAQASGTYTVYWGDGQAGYGITGDAIHTYADAGIYTVSAWNLDRIRLGDDAANAAKIRSIDSWGTARWTSMSEAFRGASGMMHTAGDVPDLSRVSSMTHMFRDSSIMEGLSGWNVSSVEDMSSAFRGAAAFDGNISGWNISSARDMSSMFRGASSFNQDISEWNVSSVEDLSYMFQDASSFNQDISGWDVSSADDMSSMFHDASSFVQNLGRWYVTADDTSIGGADIPGIVGNILAQNAFLDEQNPVYGIGAGADSARFAVLGDGQLAMISVDGAKTEYVANITASGLTVFEDGNNWKTLAITVQGVVPSTQLTVDTGSPQNVIEGDTVTLSGSITGAPPDTLMYMWSQRSPAIPQISLGNASGPTITFAAPQVGSETTFVFTLVVTDGTDSASGLAVVTVRDTTMSSSPLTVHAESHHAAYTGDRVTLSGSATGVSPGTLTYMWSQKLPTSPQIPLGDTSAQTVTFEAPQVVSETTFVFTLTATDGGRSASDPVSVTVRSHPVPDPMTVIVPDMNLTQIVPDMNLTQIVPDMNLTQIVPDMNLTQIVPDMNLTQIVPDMNLTQIVPDMNLTQIVPDMNLTQIVPDMNLTQIVPDMNLTQIVPDMNLTQIVPDMNLTQIVPDPNLPRTVPDQNLPRTGSGTGFIILPPAVTIGSLGYPESSVPASIRNVLPDIGAPVTPIPTDNTFDFPLEVNGHGYALRHHSSTLVPQNLVIGQPTSIAVTLYDRYEIPRFAVHLNLQDSQTSYLESDTHVAYDGGTIRVADPGNLMSDVSLSILQDPYNPSRKTAVLNATFSEKIGTTNMVIRTSNERGGTATITVIDALRVILAADPEPVEPESLAEPWSRDGSSSSSSSSEGGMLAIRMWSGFEPESITYAELLHVLGLTGYRDADIPRWVMTELGPLAAKNLITVEQFRTALQYVIENT